jgi:preprotein translocase subunit Sec61beta
VFGLFNSLVWILPFLTVLFLALAIWAAPNTRRAWLWLGIGLIIVTLLPFEALVFSRTAFISAAYSTAQIPTDAAQAFWDIFFQFLVTMQITAITVGLVVAAIAFFAGPSKLALWFRHAIARGIALARGSADFGKFGEFFAANKAALRIGAVALGVIIDILSAPLTPGFVVGTAIFVGFLVLLIEFFGQEPAQPELALAGVGTGGVMEPASYKAPAESAPVQAESPAAEAAGPNDVTAEETDDVRT